MSEEEYIKLKNQLEELSIHRSDMIDRNEFNTEEYKKVKELCNQISDIITEYEKQKVDFLLNEKFPKDYETCLSMLDPEETYSIGIHKCGMNNAIKSDPSKLADSFFEKGIISARREGGGVVENVHVLGTENIDEKLANILQELYVRSVSYGNGGVIVAIPATMLTNDDERAYIGEFPNDLEFVAKDDPRTYWIPINRFVDKLGYLPPEFIMGVVSQNEKGDISFINNKRYISCLSVEEQKELYEKFISEGLVPKEFVHQESKSM